MKASTQYNDLIGTAAADITDFGTSHNTLEDLSKKFKIDETKLKLIGLSIYGIDEHYVSLICIDLAKSIDGNNRIVSVSPPEKAGKLLANYFKRLHVVLFNKFDDQNPNLELKSEANWSDYMEEE